MTPKEKALELVPKFYPYVRWKMGQEDFRERAKNAALVAVDEILEHCYQVMKPFWEEVKQEIKLL